MTVSGADRENYRRQMHSFENRLDKIIELLEALWEELKALAKQGEEVNKK